MYLCMHVCPTCISNEIFFHMFVSNHSPCCFICKPKNVDFVKNLKMRIEHHVQVEIVFVCSFLYLFMDQINLKGMKFWL